MAIPSRITALNPRRVHVLITDPRRRLGGIVFAIGALPPFYLMAKFFDYLVGELSQQLGSVTSLINEFARGGPCVIAAYFWGACYATQLIGPHSPRHISHVGWRAMFFTTWSVALGYAAFLRYCTTYSPGLAFITIPLAIVGCVISPPFGILAALIVNRRMIARLPDGCSQSETFESETWDLDGSRIFELLCIVLSSIAAGAAFYFAM